MPRFSRLSAAVLSVATGVTSLYSFSYAAQSARQPVRAAIADNQAALAEEQARIGAAELAERSVVSVIISKDLPVLERYEEEFNFNGMRIRVPRVRRQGSEEQVVGGGTAFFVSADGLLMTNRHVVGDPKAQYTVLLNDGKKAKAQVLYVDTERDIALLKVAESSTPFLQLAPDNSVRLAQTAIAIGNALGEYSNTVSAGVVSGTRRSVEAGIRGGFETELLSGLIQTDAAINQGNSGGPLLNLQGQVIGMNTAVAAQAQSIGFAIPVEALRDVLEHFKRS